MEADLVDWVGSQQSKKKLNEGDLVSNLRYSVFNVFIVRAPCWHDEQ